MRFIIAASVLGWTLPLAQESQAFREEIWEWTTEQEHNIKGTRIVPKHQTIRERVLRKTTTTLLQNSHHRHHIMEEKECDPTSVDSDIGILSCGYNEYCVASESSLLGGQCIPTSKGHLLRRRVQEEDSSYNETTQNLFEDLLADCELPYCNCSNVNETAYTLNQICYYEEECGTYLSRCGVNATDCVSVLWEGHVTKPYTYDVSVCVKFTNNAGLNISMCYNSTHYNSTAMDCAISLNGQSCASCKVVPTFYETFYYPNGTVYAYNITPDCYHFDCTNVEGGWVGNDCARLPEFWDSYGCVDCPICGPGEIVTSPDAILISASRSDLEVDEATQCGDGPILNDLTQEECDQIQSVADQVCGCVLQDEEDTSTSPPTDDQNESSIQLPDGEDTAASPPIAEASLLILSMTFVVAMLVFG